MVSRNPHKVWYTEMKDLLQSRWTPELRLDDVIDLSAELDTIYTRIRREANIQPPMMTCQECGTRHRAAEHRISARAVYLAAKRFGWATADQVRPLEREWNKRRKAGEIELYPTPSECV